MSSPSPGNAASPMPVSSPMPPPQSTSPAVGGPPQASSPMGPPNPPNQVIGQPPSTVPQGMPPSQPVPPSGGPPMHHPYPPPQGWTGPPGSYPPPPNSYPQQPGGAPMPPHVRPPTPTSSPATSLPNSAPFPPSGGSSIQDSLRDLQKSISTMEEKGMTNDPRYNELVAMRSRYSSMAHPGAEPPSGVPGGPEGPRPPMGGGPNPISAAQMYQLRGQIIAYRCIARSQPVPNHICLISQGRRVEQDPNKPPVSAPGQNAVQPNMGYPRPPGPQGKKRKFFVCCIYDLIAFRYKTSL